MPQNVAELLLKMITVLRTCVRKSLAVTEANGGYQRVHVACYVQMSHDLAYASDQVATIARVVAELRV
jgi:hypothetical protein